MGTLTEIIIGLIVAVLLLAALIRVVGMTAVMLPVVSFMLESG
jgi:hypothetical protein